MKRAFSESFVLPERDEETGTTQLDTIVIGVENFKRLKILIGLKF